MRLGDPIGPAAAGLHPATAGLPIGGPVPGSTWNGLGRDQDRPQEAARSRRCGRRTVPVAARNRAAASPACSVFAASPALARPPDRSPGSTWNGHWPQAHPRSAPTTVASPIRTVGAAPASRRRRPARGRGRAPPSVPSGRPARRPVRDGALVERMLRCHLRASRPDRPVRSTWNRATTGRRWPPASTGSARGSSGVRGSRTPIGPGSRDRGLGRRSPRHPTPRPVIGGPGSTWNSEIGVHRCLTLGRWGGRMGG